MTTYCAKHLASPVLAAAILSTVACGGSRSNQPDELAANRGLPAWAGEMQALFDDQFEPAAFGMSMSGTKPSQDPMLPLRAQAADVCARMRVQTVTSDTAGTSTTFGLSMQVGLPTLMPALIEDRSFELLVPPTSNSFSMVQSMENTLGGRTFIGFVKRFAGVDGPEIHYHLTSDNEEVAKAIQQVSILEELARQ